MASYGSGTRETSLLILVNKWGHPRPPIHQAGHLLPKHFTSVLFSMSFEDVEISTYSTTIIFKKTYIITKKLTMENNSLTIIGILILYQLLDCDIHYSDHTMVPDNGRGDLPGRQLNNAYSLRLLLSVVIGVRATSLT
jgi:branched-subunit amino acid transport protein AzlD